MFWVENICPLFGGVCCIEVPVKVGFTLSTNIEKSLSITPPEPFLSKFASPQHCWRTKEMLFLKSTCIAYCVLLLSKKQLEIK